MGRDVLLRRGNTILLVTAIALFTLSSVLAVINLTLGAAEIDEIDSIPYDQLNQAAMIIYGVNNSIADGLVIYRCYVIWNNNWRVTILPIMMLIASTVFGLDFTLSPFPFFGLTLATNVVVTILTGKYRSLQWGEVNPKHRDCVAGRIWWICRHSRAYLKAAEQRRYVSSIAILVESGMVYSAGILAYLIVISIPSVANRLAGPILQMLSQVMGIAPTIIIVRVGLGASVENVERSVKTMETMSTICPPQHVGIWIGQRHGNLDETSTLADVEKGQLNHSSRKLWSFGEAAG
ncbi:hypothetical protein B0H13DRAFT_1881676 [Mycena leptocephala]|nr:hypothetical protein B0H13DRAFT_1881676 [Mycena leptocephala]